MCPSSAAEDWVAGAIDLHVHAAPSIFPRSLDDRELVERAGMAGMAGMVLKAHEGSTVERARLVSGEVEVVGGVVLNRFVGGINPEAVEAALAMGARMVWMPTVHAANHVARYGDSGFPGHRPAVPERGRPPLSVLDDRGGIREEVRAVLDLLADHPQAVLCNGHLGERETALLFGEARRRGAGRLLLAHPELAVSESPVAFQEEMAGLGAYVERTYLPHLPGWGEVPIERTAARIRAVGVARSILASELGQRDTPPPVEGLAAFCRALWEAGLEEAEIRTMTVRNPFELLGPA